MADISLINVRAFANYEPKNTFAECKLLWLKHVQMATAVHCKIMSSTLSNLSFFDWAKDSDQYSYIRWFDTNVYFTIIVLLVHLQATHYNDQKI